MKSHKGFTLIEILIYIAIVGMVVTAFIFYALSIANNRNKAFSVAEVQASVREAMNIIHQSIKKADGVNIGSSTFNSDPGVLYLIMDSAEINPTIIELNQDDGNLVIIEGAGTPVKITSELVEVTNLVFTDLSGGSSREHIKIDLTLRYKNESNDPGFDYTQTVTSSVSVRQ